MTSHAVTEFVRLPPGAAMGWLFSGRERSVFQVVGACEVLRDEVKILWSDGTDWRPWSLPITWLRGSARALAEALNRERR